MKLKLKCLKNKNSNIFHETFIVLSEKKNQRYIGPVKSMDGFKKKIVNIQFDNKLFITM